MLDLPHADGSSVVEQNTIATFLDEFRMMVLTPRSTPDAPEFSIFNTLIPHNHPGNSWRFCAPSRYHHWLPSVHVDSDRCLGSLDRDRPFTTDPTQAVLAVKLVSPNGSSVSLVVRIQTLIEHVHSTADARVPWDVWGRNSVVIEVLTPSYARSGPCPLVQGVHAIFVKLPPAGRNHHHPHFLTFDLSRRGWSILPLWDGDGTERRAIFEDGRKFLLQGGGSVVRWRIYSLGDDKLMYLVSCFRRWESTSRLMPSQDQLSSFGWCVARLGVCLSGSLALPKVARTWTCAESQ